MPQTKGRPKKGLRGGKNLRNINKKYNEDEENNYDEENDNGEFELASSSSQSVLDKNNNKTSLSDIISNSQKRKSMNFEEDDGFVFRRASQQSTTSSQPSKASLESYQNKLQSDAITPLRKPYQPYVPRSVRAKKEAEEAAQAAQAAQAASLKHQKLKSRMRILSPIKAKKIPIKKKTDLEKEKEEEDPKPKRGRKKSTSNPSAEEKDKIKSPSLFSNNKPNSKKPNLTSTSQTILTKPPSLNLSVLPPLNNNNINVPKLSQSKNIEKDLSVMTTSIDPESTTKVQDPIKKTRKKTIRKPVTTKVTKSKATANKNSSSKKSDKVSETPISLLDTFSLIDDADEDNENNNRSTFKFKKTSNNYKPKIQVFSFDSPEKEPSPEPILKKRKITNSPSTGSKKIVDDNFTIDKQSKSKRNPPREKSADDKNKLNSKTKKGASKNLKRDVIEGNEQIMEEFDPFINALDDPVQEDDTPFVDDIDDIFTEKYTRANLSQSLKSASDGMESAEEVNNNDFDDIRKISEDDDSEYESAEIEKIPLNYSPSKKSTTKIDRTTRRNSQDRRLSLSNRGKRLSSIGNGFVAEPHEDVPEDDFYKHLDNSLPEPHRMRQLLIWSCKRLISKEKKSNEDYKLTESGYNDLSIKIANSIKEEIVKDLVDGKINTSWWVMDDDEDDNKTNGGTGNDLSHELSQSSQNNINKPIIILPNEQNQKNFKSLKMLEKRLAECKREDKTWTDCSEYELTNSSNFKEVKIPKDYNEIIGKDAIINSSENFSKLKAVIDQLYESKENYKSKITDELEDSVDDFTHMIHKLKSVTKALEILSDSKMIEFSSKMRESLDKDINGEYSIDSMKLLKGFARLNPSDKD
ncbi:hypothetical protein B5S32_g3256 [[Candida] boidinii]|nr:hypothetical protein B5S32_g3256 [[Candida] boidinii]